MRLAIIIFVEYQEVGFTALKLCHVPANAFWSMVINARIILSPLVPTAHTEFPFQRTYSHACFGWRWRSRPLVSASLARARGKGGRCQKCLYRWHCNRPAVRSLRLDYLLFIIYFFQFIVFWGSAVCKTSHTVMLSTCCPSILYVSVSACAPWVVPRACPYLRVAEWFWV